MRYFEMRYFEAPYLVVRHFEAPRFEAPYLAPCSVVRHVAAEGVRQLDVLELDSP